MLVPTKLAAKYVGLWGFNIDTYFENVLRSNQWDVQDNLLKILKPVDFDEFDMTPATVNAYYNPPLVPNTHLCLSSDSFLKFKKWLYAL